MCCGSLIGILAGCCCSFCGSCCCSITARECSASEKFKKGPASRIPYIFLTFLALMFSIVMTLYGEQTFGRTAFIAPNGITVCQTESCQNNGVVYRVSFSLFVFFLIHAVMVYFVPEFHTLWLLIKFVMFCLFLTATFFFGTGGTGFFDGWSQFARVASTIFLLLQVVILVTWAYGVYDDVVARVDKMQKDQDDELALKEDPDAKPPCCNMLCCYSFSILMSAWGLIILAFVLCGFFYSWFNSATANCDGEVTLVAITMVYLVVTLCFTCAANAGSQVFGEANEFVTGVIDLYVVYLLYSGLSSNPNRACNTVFGKKEGSGSFWLGIIITAAALSYIGFGVSRQYTRSYQNNPNNTNDVKTNMEGYQELEGQELEAGGKRTKKEGDEDPVTRPTDDHHLDLGLDDDEKDAKKRGGVSRAEATGENKTEEQLEEESEQKANVMFHTCMALASIYICMLYTNWGQNVSANGFAGENSAALWVNITAQWVTFILYTWTILGPAYCNCLGVEEEQR